MKGVTGGSAFDCHLLRMVSEEPAALGLVYRTHHTSNCRETLDTLVNDSSWTFGEGLTSSLKWSFACSYSLVVVDPQNVHTDVHGS